MVFSNLLSDIISNLVGRDLTIIRTKITQPQMALLEMVILETCSSLISLSKYEIEKPNDPDICAKTLWFYWIRFTNDFDNVKGGELQGVRVSCPKSSKYGTGPNQ